MLTLSAKTKLLALYPPYDSVLGPYQRKDGRFHLVLNNSKLPKGANGKTRTVSYPKALLEVRLKRRLLVAETADHKDDNFLNNSKANLQVLTRKENASKGHLTGACSARGLADYSRSDMGRRRSSERMTAYNKSRV